MRKQSLMGFLHEDSGLFRYLFAVAIHGIAFLLLYFALTMGL